MIRFSFTYSARAADAYSFRLDLSIEELARCILQDMEGTEGWHPIDTAGRTHTIQWDAVRLLEVRPWQ